ncbi:MAG TPA: hypothetical protein VNP73_09280 [Actinomycetota bacterium]|nr:hypothetical protein [Actinomycetota bacterium]
MERRSLVRLGAVVAAVVALWGLPAAPAVAGVEDGSVVIETNTDFTGENGVRKGNGTKKSPYVIEGWDLNTLEIHDTNRYVVIRNNIINRLTLNWVGSKRVKVVQNRVGDLRVNENVERTGAATSGIISHNRFQSVGQLRHWDGVFSHNVVGFVPEDGSFQIQFGEASTRAVNFDGFNGAKFVHNKIYGYVEARLHGHHHSSGYEQGSHYHGAGHEAAHGGRMPLTHMERFHRVKIANNEIHAVGPYGLIYTDSNHAGNDRTAASETNEALNDPHEHTTQVAIVDNNLHGSGIVVDIFNADDDRHLRTNTGHFTIRENTIRVKEYRNAANAWDAPAAGIDVHQARDLHLHILDNVITGPKGDQTPSAGDTIGGYVTSGIKLQDIEKAYIHLTTNEISSRQVAVYARQFSRVQWWISGMRTQDVVTEVDYDNSSNQPRNGP